MNRAEDIGLLTNAGVIAADTIAGLQAFINGASVHADNQNYKARMNAALTKDAGITDAAVLNLTTVAGLVALTSMGSGTQPMLLD